MRLISVHADAVRALERLRVPFDDVTPEGLWGSPYHLIGVTAEQRAVLDSWNLEVNDVTPEVLAGTADLAPQLKESWPQPKPRAVLADVLREPVREAAREPAREPARKLPSEAPREPAREQRDEPREQPIGQQQEAAAADAEVPVPMHEERRNHGDPLEREIVERAAAEAEKRVEARTDGPAQSAAQGAVQAPAKRKNGTAVFTAPSAAPKRRDPTRLRVSIGGKYREASVQQGKIVLDGKTFDSPAAATKSVAPSKGDWVFWEYFDADAGKWRMLDRDWLPSQHAS